MPLKFFFGDEDYLIEKEICAYKKKILGAQVDELNFRTLENPDFMAFDEAMRSVPMLFGDVVYVIKCPKYFLETKSKEKLDDKQTAQLIESMENIDDRVHILLVVATPRGEKKKPDSRKKLFKAVQKIGEIKEFPSYRTYEEAKIAPILRTLAKEKDIIISPGVISLLIQYVGSSIRELDTTLEKLKLFAYPKKEIEPDMLDKVATFGQDVTKIPDLVLKKDYTKALSEISKLLERSHFLEVLGFLQTSFTNLLKTKLYSKTLGAMEISRKTGVHEFVVKKNLEKLSKMSFKELLDLKINLTEAEFKLKTGQIDPIGAFCEVFYGVKNDR